MVIAVNRYMKGDIRPNRENQLSLPELGLDSLYWSYEDGEVVFAKTSKRLNFIKNTLEVSLQYLSERKFPLHLFLYGSRVSSMMHPEKNMVLVPVPQQPSR